MFLLKGVNKESFLKVWKGLGRLRRDNEVFCVFRVSISGEIIVIFRLEGVRGREVLLEL